MADILHNDGKNKCDRCGIVDTDVYSTFGDFPGYKHLCNRCDEILRKEKKEKEKFQKELDSLKEQQSNQVKEQKKTVRKERNVSSTYSGGTSGWDKFLVVMKWIFSYVWGGPYLAIQGYKNKNRFWLIIGIEFTIVFLVAAVLVNVIPDLTSSTEPINVFISSLLGILLAINIGALVVYWVKFREE